MSVWKEELNKNIDNYKNNEILELLDWLTNKKEREDYKQLYNNIDSNLKEKILFITLKWLAWNYIWNIEKKQAQAFLFKNAINLVININFYNHKLYVKNEKDISLWIKIRWLYVELLRSYPWVKDAFSEEEIEIIRNLGKEEKK